MPILSGERYDIDPERENRPLPAANRPPILETMGPHPYKESEFPEGKGRCDLCGGGPEAEIHLPHVDPLVRVAVALERLADLFERIHLIGMGDYPGKLPHA